jgi:hypothetical protein
MKATLVLSALAVAAWSVGGEREAEEKLIQDTLQSFRDVTAILKTVKDAKSAEAALVKLDDPAERLVVRMQALKAIFEKSASKELQAKHGKALSEANAAFQAEMQRLNKQSEALKVLNTNKEWKGLVSHILVGSPDRARLDIKSLEKAVQTYEVKYGRLPATLQELTERLPDNSPALLKKEALTDPWGQPYIYDPNQRHPTTDIPLILSMGDPAQGGKAPIRNWDPPKDKEQIKDKDKDK